MPNPQMSSTFARTRLAPLAAMLLVGLSLVVFSRPAQAGNKDKVFTAFKGQIILSADELPAPDPEDPKATIAAYKKARLSTLESHSADGVAHWNFSFMAFMKQKPKTSSLSLEFYTDDKEKLFVADKRMNGADPNVQILSSSISISEDENINKGRKYILKLVAKQGKKDVVLATTKLSTK